MHDIKYLFEPRSVAVIGATDNPLKLGNVVIKNVVSSGYQGRVYPVNPKGGEILGMPVIKNIAEAGESVDLAVVVIPANLVFESIKSCADSGVKFAAIITSGFSEVGNVAEEKKIVTYAREHGLRILGPNIVGIYSYPARLNATFGAAGTIGGSLALLSQSGALAGAIAGKVLVENIGLSAMVAVGNKADIDESDLLEYLAHNEQTKVIMMYMEGVTHGERLVNILSGITRVKPVVALKAGKSRRGAMAAASHTGSLAGEDKVFDDIARQCGIIRADCLEQALEWCKYLSNTPEPAGDNTVIITNGGGLGVLTADACEQHGVSLYDDQADLKKIFADIVPNIGSIKNPVDITGQAIVNDYMRCIDASLADENIHSIMVLGCETGVFDADGFAVAAAESFKTGMYNKPVILSFVGGSDIEENIKKLRSMGMPIFNDVSNATACLGAIYRNHRNRTATEYPVEEISIDIDAIRKVVAGARKEGRRFLLANEERHCT
jgi:acetyl coenzyme A synthetase (ADP forming)-like protein